MVTQQMFDEDKWFDYTDNRIKEYAKKAPKNWTNAKFITECSKHLCLNLSNEQRFLEVYSKYRPKRTQSR